MRYLLYIWLFTGAGFLAGQAGGGVNPFELIDRLPAGTDVTSVDSTINPFDLRKPSVAAPSPTVWEPAPVVLRPERPEPDDAGIIFIHLLLLVMLASLWVLFRGLLGRCFAAIFNDSVMTELYRRRSGGQVGALWLCYGLFLLAGGFFLYLLGHHYALSLGLGIWGSWLTCALLIAGAVGVKFLLLLLLGRVYPLRKELSRYAFALMVFSILTGLLLVPVNLLVSYAPEELREYFLLGGLGLLLLIYLLHLLRGLFIANRYVGTRPLQFLLYLCTIEIAPVLLIFRYLSNTLQ